MTASPPRTDARTSDIECMLERERFPVTGAMRPYAALLRRDVHFTLGREGRASVQKMLGDASLDLLADDEVEFHRATVPRLPKDIPWTAYPLIGGPYWSAGHLFVQHIRGFNDTANVAAERALHYLANARAWVVFGGTRWDDCLSAARLLSLMPPGVAPMGIYRVDWGERRIIPWADSADAARAAVERCRALDRFHWAYRVNMLGLGTHLVRAVKAPAGTRLANYGDGADLAHPWLIQILFGLRRLAQGIWEGQPVPPRQDSATDDVPFTAFPGAVASGDPGKRGPYGLYWPGTRRWPPCLGDNLQWEDMYSFQQACHRLLDIGLAEVPPGQECARITRWGERLLDLLPPAMEDPDVLLRWRQGPGGLPREEDIPAMDRWLNNAFRQLKRRLNGIFPDGVMPSPEP